MIRKLKAVLISLTLVIGLGAPVALSTSPVFASESSQAACRGIGLTGGGCGDQANNEVSSLFRTIVNILTFIVGAAAVIMVILSGFKYITAGGDSNNIASAKNTLIYAVIGLIIVALAQFIVNFVLTSL